MKIVKRYARYTVPMGQAFLIVMLANVMVGIITLMSATSGLEWRAEFESIPDSVNREILKEGEPVRLAGKFFGCYWKTADQGDSGVSLKGAPEGVSIYCQEKSFEKNVKADFTVSRVKDFFPQKNGWKITDSSIHVESATSSFGAIFYVFAIVAFSCWLATPINVDKEMRRLKSSLLHSPWIFLVPALTVLIASSIFGSLLPEAPVDAPQAFQAVLATNSTSLFSIIVVAPLFEEVVFRGWLYRKTAGLNKHLAAIGGAWFFMLAHIFNPQVSVIPAYLPTMFCLGCALYYLRATSGSLSVVISAHILNNAIFLVAGFVFFELGAVR